MDVEAIDPADRADLTAHLLPGELVIEAFRASSTLALFTANRILLVQRQSLLSERVETSSYSYRAMIRFSVLEGEPGDSRNEIKIWLGSDPQPLHLRANGATAFVALQRLLAQKLS